LSARDTLLIVPVTESSPQACREAMAAAAAGGADAVELRLDFLPDMAEKDLPLLLKDPPCPILATCRAAAEGGQCDWSNHRRASLLAQAVRLGARWVDFELAALGEAGELLTALGEARAAELIVSYHNFQRRPDDLAAILARLEASPGQINKIAFAAGGPEDAWEAFDLLRRSRKPAMVLAMGECGVASRILARKFGAFGTFAALAEDRQSAPGQPTLAELRGLYRWKAISATTHIYGVVGCPVSHSLSPAIHNAAFAAERRDAVYVPLRVESGAEPFNRFLDAVLARPWTDLRGLSVTLPHKENALARVGADNVDELARQIGAINTLAITSDAARPLRGWNTDYAAAMDVLAKALDGRRESLHGRRAAVLGAGGVARAIVAALAHYGADTTVYNRTLARAQELAREFDRGAAGPVRAMALEELVQLKADIIINCTPLGMHPHVQEGPLPKGVALPAGAIVFDTIYNPIRTRLLSQAAQGGCRTLSGLEMFLNQAAAQYELWTYRSAPRQVMRQVVLARLGQA
jgi:3-dehydroquinate dehydratase / shikimate dehydrogenase